MWAPDLAPLHGGDGISANLWPNAVGDICHSSELMWGRSGGKAPARPAAHPTLLYLGPGWHALAAADFICAY